MTSVVEHVIVPRRDCDEEIVNHSFIAIGLNELT